MHFLTRCNTYTSSKPSDTAKQPSGPSELRITVAHRWIRKGASDLHHLEIICLVTLKALNVTLFQIPLFDPPHTLKHPAAQHLSPPPNSCGHAMLCVSVFFYVFFPRGEIPSRAKLTLGVPAACERPRRSQRRASGTPSSCLTPLRRRPRQSVGIRRRNLSGVPSS
jgi:hypothetical protein